MTHESNDGESDTREESGYPAVASDLGAVLDRISDQVYALDRDWRFTFLNAPAEEFLGRSRDELVGRFLWEEYPQIAEAVREEYRLAMERQEPRVFAGASEIAPGRWLEIHAYPSPDGLSVYCRDVTDEQRAREALGRRERQLAQAQKIAGLGSWEYDLATGEVVWSEEMYRILGLEPGGGITFAGFLDRLHPSDREQVVDAIARCGRDGRPLSEEFRVVRPDGEERHVQARGEMVDVGEGRAPKLYGTVQDVTEKKRIEGALHASEARLLRVTATSPAVLYTVALGDERLRATWVSANIEATLGYTVEEALAPDWWTDGLHPEDRNRAEAVLPLLLDRGVVTQEYRFRHKNGTYRWIRDQLRLLEAGAGGDAADAVEGVEGVEGVGSWLDATEFHQLEEQFRQQQRLEAVGRLAGGVAHDFNNMLTAIQGYAQLAMDAVPEGSPVRDDLQEILNAADGAHNLTSQLLAFSRQQVSDRRVVDPGELVRATQKLLRRLIGDDVELEVHLAEDLGRIIADPTQVEQVLVNLAVNARDAMPDGGRLEVRAENVDLSRHFVHSFPYPVLAGPYVRISVSDTGTGMDPEVQERIFEPFFTTKPGEKGTGLGLSTVYGIVKQTGGYIWVYSEPDAGTTFKIFLPRTDEEAAEGASVGLDVGDTRGSETVLVAEDQPAVRSLVRRALEADGYQVLEAGDGVDALRLAEEHDGAVDLLLTDVVMPRMGGRELADRMRAVDPGLRVLYMSGYAEEQIARRGVLDPGTHLLEKPFEPATLKRQVRDALDRPS
jgi:PAS domain S-box-containing protein